MNKIALVTAFFDCGRSDWEGPHLPSYLKRTTDQYFERFENLLQLDNTIVVFTEYKFFSTFDNLQKKYPNLYVHYEDDWRIIWNKYRPQIEAVLSSKEYLAGIQQPWNPEYWSVDYLMVNFLKSYFVNEGIKALEDYFELKHDLYAWIDFGYARDISHIPLNFHWEYNFNPDKIHFFSFKQNVPLTTDIRNLIETNNVFIMGCHIVASKEKWKYLELVIKDNIEFLLKNNLCDDDQTLLYMCYIDNPDLFQIHYIDSNHGCGWFQIFHTFNRIKNG